MPQTQRDAHGMTGEVFCEWPTRPGEHQHGQNARNEKSAQRAGDGWAVTEQSIVKRADRISYEAIVKIFAAIMKRPGTVT